MQIPRFKWPMNKCGQRHTHTHQRESIRFRPCHLHTFRKCVNFINSILPLQTLALARTPPTTKLSLTRRLQCSHQNLFFSFSRSSFVRPHSFCCPRKSKESSSVIPSAWKCNYIIWEWDFRIRCGDVGSIQKTARDHIYHFNSGQTLFALAVTVVIVVVVAVWKLGKWKLVGVHYCSEQCVRLHLCLIAINIKCDLWHYTSILCEKGI